MTAIRSGDHEGTTATSIAIRLFGVALLVSLGIWQLHRLEWKDALLARLDAAAAATPVALIDSPPDFARIASVGTWDPVRSASVGVESRESGGRIVMGRRFLGIWRRGGSGPVLVDRGWLPDGVAPPDPTATSIVGYVMPPERPGLLTARDDPSAHRYYAMDPSVIGRDLGLPAEVADPPRPANNHLSYAMTWFGLAALLLFGPLLRRLGGSAARRLGGWELIVSATNHRTLWAIFLARSSVLSPLKAAMNRPSGAIRTSAVLWSMRYWSGPLPVRTIEYWTWYSLATRAISPGLPVKPINRSENCRV